MVNKNIADPQNQATHIGHVADRSVPNWGKTHPLPALEAVIDELNQLAGRAKASKQTKQPATDFDWEQARAAAYMRAAQLLGVDFRVYGSGFGDREWNATISALDHYRADWRGQVVSRSSSAAFLKSVHKRADWALVAKQARRAC